MKPRLPAPELLRGIGIAEDGRGYGDHAGSRLEDRGRALERDSPNGHQHCIFTRFGSQFAPSTPIGLGGLLGRGGKYGANRQVIRGLL